jgi:translocation and assembly module TamB
LPQVVAAQASFHLTLADGGAPRAEAALDGRYGTSPVVLHAALDGQKATATLGARVGDGSLDVRGEAALGETKRVHASAVVDRVDPSLVLAGGPSLAIRASADAHATIGPSGAVDGEMTFRSEPTRLAAQDIPALEGHARFTSEKAAGTLHADEPGAPADVDFQAAYGGSSATVDLEARMHSEDLAAVPQLRTSGVRGGAEVHADAHVDLGHRMLDARIEARASSLARGPASARRAAAQGRLHGTMSGPTVDVAVEAEDVRLTGRRFDTVAASARGTPNALAVAVAATGGGFQRVRANALLALGPGVTARRVEAAVTRDAATLTLRAERARVEGRRLEVTGVEVTGVGQPIRGRVSATPGEVDLQLAAPEVDIGRATAVLGLRPRSGRASLDVALRADRRGATGHVDGAFESRSIAGVDKGTGRIAMRFDHRHIEGGAQFDLDGTRATATFGDLVLGGPPLDPIAWRRASGSVDIDASLDLATVNKILPEGVLPFEDMAGRLEARAHVARKGADGAPDLTFEAKTTGLALVGRPRRGAKPTDVAAAESAPPPPLPWETRDLDLTVSVRIASDSNELTAQGSLTDRLGRVIDLDVRARPDVAQLLRDRTNASTLLLKTPLEAHARLPMREVSNLPPLLRPGAVHGKVGVKLDLDGEVDSPRLHLDARALGVTSMQAPSALPFDGTLDVTYDGHAAILRALAQRPEGVVLDVRADADARIGDLLATAEKAAAWDAGATIALHGFPLEGIPQIATHGLGGRATGVVTLEGLHRAARLDADLQIAKPRLGIVCLDRGWLRVAGERDRLVASARFDGPDSSATATIDAGARWGSQLTPAIDTARPIDLALQAHHFRAAALQPLVQGIFNQLDGSLDADARIHVEPELKAGTMTGEVRLSKGILEIEALGEQLHDVTARATIQPWGTLRLDDLSAGGTTGSLTGRASAQFDGTRLRSASADLQIASGQRMPVTIQGISYGEASGRVHADATMASDQNELDVEVQVPDFEIRLPEAAGHSVQSLDPAPHIVVGARLAHGEFVAVPLHPPQRPRSDRALKVHAVVHLGNAVRIRRDTSLEVQLAGTPVVDLTDQAHIQGVVQVVEGTVEVFGKRFKIERSSTVSFTGDSGNPQLRVSAVYTGPDETRVYADVVGPLKSLNVHLRSEPQRSQDEILGLILFGGDQGLGGTPPPDQQPDPTQRAAGLASGVVTEGINKALSGITSLDIATRVDTSQAANPRPQVEVRITNDVVASVTVNTGMPAPGEPPDRTLLAVDWRFRPRWSLETTVGDQGSTFVDLLWRHRY